MMGFMIWSKLPMGPKNQQETADSCLMEPSNFQYPAVKSYSVCAASPLVHIT